MSKKTHCRHVDQIVVLIQTHSPSSPTPSSYTGTDSNVHLSPFFNRMLHLYIVYNTLHGSCESDSILSFENVNKKFKKKIKTKRPKMLNRYVERLKRWTELETIIIVLRAVYRCNYTDSRKSL